MLWVQVIESNAVDRLLAPNLLILAGERVAPSLLRHGAHALSGRVELKKAEMPSAMMGKMIRAPMMYCSNTQTSEGEESCGEEYGGMQPLSNFWVYSLQYQCSPVRQT